MFPFWSQPSFLRFSHTGYQRVLPPKLATYLPPKRRVCLLSPTECDARCNKIYPETLPLPGLNVIYLRTFFGPSGSESVSVILLYRVGSFACLWLGYRPRSQLSWPSWVCVRSSPAPFAQAANKCPLLLTTSVHCRLSVTVIRCQEKKKNRGGKHKTPLSLLGKLGLKNSLGQICQSWPPETCETFSGKRYLGHKKSISFRSRFTS